jgi:TP901 family phage tail tape measure protein
MAIEIQVQTGEAQGNVGALNAGVDQLRTTLRDCYTDATKLNGAFSFADSAAEALREVRNEFQMFTQMMKDMRSEMDAVVQSGSSIVQTSQAQSKAFLATAQSLQQQANSLKSAQQATQQLTQAQQAQAAAQQAGVAAMGRLSPLLKETADSSSVLRSRLTDLDAATAAYAATNGKVGLSAQQAQAVLRSIGNEYDTLTAKERAAGAGAVKFAAELDISTQAAAGFRAGLEGAGLGFGIFTGETILAATAIFALAHTIKDTLEVGAAFENIMVRGAVFSGDYTTAIDKQGQTVTKVGLQTKLLVDQSQELSTTTKFSSQEFLEAAAKMEQASVTLNDTYASMQAVANLATISNSSLVESASNLVSISHTFGLSFQDSERTVAQLAIGITSARTSVESIAKSLEYVGPIARTAGLDLGQTTAAIVTLNKAGIESDKAGTSLRALFNTLGKETPAAKRALDELGLSFHDFWTKDGLDFVGMLDKINSKLKDHSIEDQMKLLTALFRTQGQTGATFLMQNIEDLKKFSEEMKTASDHAQKLADAMNQTTEVAFKEFRNEIKNIEQDAFTNFDSGLYDSIKQLTQYLKDNAAAISQGIADAISALMSLTKFVVEHAGSITTLIEVYAAFKLTLMGVQAAMKLYETVIVAVRAAQLALAASSVAAELGIAGTAAAAGTASTAMTAMGLAGEAGLAAIGGPVTLVAAGIAAVLYGVYKLHEGLEIVPQDVSKLADEVNKFKVVEGQITTMNFDALKSLGKDESLALQDMNKQLLIAQQNLEKYKMAWESAFYNEGGMATPQLDEADAKYKELLTVVNMLKTGVQQLNTEAFEIQAAQLVRNSSLFTTYLQASTKSASGLATFGKEVKTAEGFLSNFQTILAALPKNFLALDSSSQGLQQILKTMMDIINAQKQQKTENDNKSKEDADKARAQELATELRTIVDEYAKLNYSPDILIHSLNEIKAITGQLASSASAASQELHKLGVSNDFARQALQAAAVKDAFDQMKIGLTNIDPAFAKLKQSIGDNSQQTDALGKSYELVDTMVANASKQLPSAAAAFEQMGEKVKASLGAIKDGTYDLKTKFDELTKSAPIAFEKLIAQKGSLDDFVKSFLGLNTEVTEAQRNTAAFALAQQDFSFAYKSTATEADRLNLFMQVNNQLLKAGTINATEYAKAYKTFYDSTATGTIEKQNENLQNQVTLLASGVTNLGVYNTLWQATKGDLSQVTEGMLKAATAQQKLNEQVQQIQQVQQIYKSFADNLTNVFKNVFDGVDKNFKDVAKDITHAFKNMLEEMVLAAIKNQIMFSMGFTSQGNSPGFFSAISNIFGGNGQQPQQQPVGPAPIGGGMPLNFGALLQSSISNSTGYDISSGSGSSGSGGFGGTNLLSLVGAGRTAFSGGSAAGSAAGGFDYFDSVFGAPSAGGAGSLSLAQNTAAGGINLSAGAGAGAGPGFFGSAASYGGFAGILGGVTAGIGEYQAAGGGVGGVAGGIAYGVGTAALMGAASTALTSGLAAGMAAIPVVGWIALAAMAINMISGGKLFGTAWKPTGSTTTYDIGQTGADLTSVTHETRQRAFFGGTARKDVNNPVDPQAQAQAQQMFQDIQGAGREAQQKLGVTLSTMVEGSFQQLYDKKGKLKDQLSTVLGVVYHESIEDFVAREKAEQVVAAVGQSIKEMGGQAEEASSIAQKYRANANDLADAANAMVAAQLDIKNGVGLLEESGAGVLTKTMNLVDKLNQPGEKLADTYTRLVQSTALMTSVFSTMGVALTQAREKFIEFSADVVSDLGGVQAASAAWQSFSQSIFTVTQQLVKPVANTNLTTKLTAIGLPGDESIADFSAKFRDALPQMNDQQLANWIKAGGALGTIDLALKQMNALSKGVDIASVLNQQQTLVQQVNTLVNAAAAAGASQEQLAELEAEATQAVQKQLTNFMQPIEEQLAKFTGRDYTFQLQQIQKTMESNILQAQALGASLQDLSDIQALAAYQTAQIISSLQTSLSAAVTKLYGSTTSGANQAAAASGAAQSASESQYNAANEAATELYNQQMERYKAEKDAIQTISDFLKQSLVNALSPLGWQGQLSTSKSQFDEELIAAQSGDVNAIKDITQFAQAYLQQAQSAYGNNADYAQIFTYVTDALKGLQGQFTSATPPPGGSGNSNSSGSNSFSSSGPSGDTLTPNDKYQLAVQIAQQMGELGLALNVSVFDLMKQYGVSVDQLARDLHVDLSNIDDDTITNLKVMNGGLGTKMSDLLGQLKVTPSQIGQYFKVSADLINQGNLVGVKQLAQFLGVDIFTAMQYIGGNIQTMAKSLGLDVKALDKNSVDKLIEIAKTLGVNTSDLMTALDVSYKQLATAFGIDVDAFNASMVTELVKFATKLGLSITEAAADLGLDIGTLSSSIVSSITDGLKDLPDLPQSFTDGLSPFLTEIANAKTPDDLKQAYADLNQYLSNLPASLVAEITPLFTALGFNLIKGTGGTQDITDSQDQTNATLGDVGKDINKGFDGITGPIVKLNSQFDVPMSKVVDGLNDNYTILSQINANLRSGTSATSAGQQSAAQSQAQAQARATQTQTAALASTTNTAAAALFAAVQNSTATHKTTAAAERAEHTAELKKLQDQIDKLTKTAAKGLQATATASSTTAEAVDALHKTTKVKKKERGFKK